MADAQARIFKSEGQDYNTVTPTIAFSLEISVEDPSNYLTVEVSIICVRDL